MKKLIVGLTVMALVIVTVGYNLQNRTNSVLNKSQSETKAALLEAQDLAELEGGMRLRCIGALAGAGLLAASGPGLLVSAVGAIGVVCACDKEFDRWFHTRYQEIC